VDGPDLDAHLCSADFLDVEHHPTITLRSREVKLLGDHDYSVEGDLTIRGVRSAAIPRLKAIMKLHSDGVTFQEHDALWKSVQA
jgi:hypothetical protein